MKNITIIVAVNLTYGGLTYNTPLKIEYKHTGEFTYKQGRKKLKSAGYYYQYRLAIPTINADGKKDFWYINNEGDSYTVNKVSKFGRKLHAEITKEI